MQLNRLTWEHSHWEACSRPNPRFSAVTFDQQTRPREYLFRLQLFWAGTSYFRARRMEWSTGATSSSPSESYVSLSRPVIHDEKNPWAVFVWRFRHHYFRL